MTKYTLHGRPLKVGDRVWCLTTDRFVEITDDPDAYAWAKQAHSYPNRYAWDKPDLSKIPPPFEPPKHEPEELTRWFNVFTSGLGTRAYLKREDAADDAGNSCIGQRKYKLIPVEE